MPILLQKSKEVKMVKKYSLEDITEKFGASSDTDVSIFRLPVGHRIDMGSSKA